MSVRILNKLIDQLNKKGYIDKKEDILFHFLNEAIIHKNPSLFVKNFVRYELLKNARVQRNSKGNPKNK